MFKIGPKIQKSVNRYLYKNTVRAKYDHNMDTALFSGLGAVAEVCRFPHWEPHDAGITAMLGAIYVRSTGKAFKHLLELQPIRKRAIKIKKAAKATQK